MTQKQIAERAKLYLDQMALGFNPISGEEIPETETVREERIARCLIYVSSILEQVIANDGVVPQIAVQKQPFHLSEEDAKKVLYTDHTVSVAVLVQRINKCIDQEHMETLSVEAVRHWLREKGMISKPYMIDDIFVPTLGGKAEGLREEKRMDTIGEYPMAAFTTAGQKLIIQHCNEIAAMFREYQEQSKAGKNIK